MFVFLFVQFSRLATDPRPSPRARVITARLLSYGAPRRSDLTIINDAIKVTTLICSRYTPRVKRTAAGRARSEPWQTFRGDKSPRAEGPRRYFNKSPAVAVAVATDFPYNNNVYFIFREIFAHSTQSTPADDFIYVFDNNIISSQKIIKRLTRYILCLLL